MVCHETLVTYSTKSSYAVQWIMRYIYNKPKMAKNRFTPKFGAFFKKMTPCINMGLEYMEGIFLSTIYKKILDGVLPPFSGMIIF